MGRGRGSLRTGVRGGERGGVFLGEGKEEGCGKNKCWRGVVVVQAGVVGVVLVVVEEENMSERLEKDE